MTMEETQQITEPKQEIDKDKVLNTQSRRIVFDAVMQGFNLKEAAKQAKLGHNYTKKWVSTSNFYPLLNQEHAKIAEATGITVSNLQLKLWHLASVAEKKGKEGVARACYADLLKTIGGFQSDAPNPKSLLAKEMDKDKAKALAAAADWYYRRKYLAAQPGEVTTIDVGLCDNNEDLSDVQGQSEAEGSG